MASLVILRSPSNPTMSSDQEDKEKEAPKSYGHLKYQIITIKNEMEIFSLSK